MTRRRSLLVLAAALCIWSPARAQQPGPPPQPPPEDPLARYLFSPELIMRHQQDIGLGAEQRTAITKAIQEFQTKTVDLQWRLQDQSQRLGNLLARPSVDSVAALQQLDEVLTVEREVKRAHIALLVRIKNTLTAEQQDKLRMLRE